MRIRSFMRRIFRRSTLGTLAFIVVLVATARLGTALGEVISQARDNNSTHVDALAYGRDPVALGNNIKGEASALLFALRAIDNPDICKGERNCTINRDFRTVMEVMQWRCERFEPTAVRTAPAYDPAVHEPALGALVAACSAVSDGVQKLGPIRDTGEWRQVQINARDILAKVEAGLK